MDIGTHTHNIIHNVYIYIYIHKKFTKGRNIYKLYLDHLISNDFECVVIEFVMRRATNVGV